MGASTELTHLQYSISVPSAMAIKANKFTPKALLSAPRRSIGIPNPEGSQLLYINNVYNFEDHERVQEIRVFDVRTSESKVVARHTELSDPQWLDNETIFMLEHITTDKANGIQLGETGILVGPVENFFENHYVAGIVPGPASSFKIKQAPDGSYAVAFVAKANPNDELTNPETLPHPHSSARIYDRLWVRHWDAWRTPRRSCIWYSSLRRDPSDLTTAGTPKLVLGRIVNALAGTVLESPIQPFGGVDHFDIHPTSGILFVAKDPVMNQALHTKCNVYFSPLSSFAESPQPEPVALTLPHGVEGSVTSPVWAPCGTKAAFLAMRQDGYEADRNRVLVVPDVRETRAVVHWVSDEEKSKKVELVDEPNVDGGRRRRQFWDRSPSTVVWSADGGTLFLSVEDEGRIRLFAVGAEVDKPGEVKALTDGSSILDVRVISSTTLFLSRSSLTDSSIFQFLELPEHIFTTVSSGSRNGSTFGLSPKQVSEIWFPGAEKDTLIHAWVIRPSTYNSQEKYPLAYLIHGGPQGAWTNAWSTRWNPAIFAEQGYITICPNPTGSTGYGQHLTDAITHQWGGLPYDDLVAGFDYIGEHMLDVDTDRAVGLGASYGGYMVNWIQGHPLGRRFRALVCHDGVFSMAGQLASEELYFPFHDLGGFPGSREARRNWSRWDPSQFVEHWATPQLVVHSELDYRLTVSEGLAAFNALQVRGVESRFVTFPDENHWVLKPENSLVWHHVVLNWINRYVGLPPLCEDEELFTFEEEKKEEAS
ncbi:MAG: hypothetical protein M1822_002360 [Bathelium mastoideum]|nr:MAG: hypothetical protein M1822_002360 [Bathelium mastoideum]